MATRSLLLTCSAVLFMACGSLFDSSEDETPPPLSASQSDTVVELMARTATKLSARSQEPVQSPPAWKASAANLCQPERLVPPEACPGGGNIYFTLNLSCSGPTGCCANENPCSKDSVHVGGQGKVLYNNCVTTNAEGDRILINGSIQIGLTADGDFTCHGITSAKAQVTLNGMPSIRVNGVERCHGTVFLNATATVNTSQVTTVNGRVCGVPVGRVYNDGCVVSCANNMCCPGGSQCSTCSNGCVPVGFVDCCNGKYCNPGTRCDTANDRCVY